MQVGRKWLDVSLIICRVSNEQSNPLVAENSPISSNEFEKNEFQRKSAFRRIRIIY